MLNIYINLFRLVFPLLAISISKNKMVIYEDVDVWVKQYKLEEIPRWKAVSQLLLRYKEFRNVLYYRFSNGNILIRTIRTICKILLPKLDTLYITTPRIGKGLLIMHGFSTILSASDIGDYFTVFQQVTIGYNGSTPAKIGDNVTVYCGAKVLGASIENNSIVGANAVVIKNVPADRVAIGVPARVLERKADSESQKNYRKN